MKKKWAFIRMSADVDPASASTVFKTDHDDWHILCVRSEEEALCLAKDLKEKGFGAIEVCGAFGEQLARKMFEATDCTVPVSYVVTPEDQKALAAGFWQH